MHLHTCFTAAEMSPFELLFAQVDCCRINQENHLPAFAMAASCLTKQPIEQFKVNLKWPRSIGIGQR